MTKKNQRRAFDWPEKVAVPVFIALSFAGGMALNAFTIAEKIATKPYVDERFIDSKKYTDEKTALILKEAFEHSDTNRQAMLLELTKYNGIITSVDVKIDLMQKTVDSFFRDYYERPRKLKK